MGRMNGRWLSEGATGSSPDQRSAGRAAAMRPGRPRTRFVRNSRKFVGTTTARVSARCSKISRRSRRPFFGTQGTAIGAIVIAGSLDRIRQHGDRVQGGDKTGHGNAGVVLSVAV